MQGVGVLIGLSFPYFLVWYGFPEQQVMHWNFFIMSQVAGQMVGLLSFVLISTVIRPHLKLLSHKMQDIAQGLEEKEFDSHVARFDEDLCKIEVVSNDEIGVSAQAYNQMLHALMQAHEVQRFFNEFTQLMSENLDVNILADKTLTLLVQSTNFDGGAILVSQKGVLHLVSSTGILNADSLAEHAAIKKCINTGKPIRILLPSNIDLDGVLAQFNPSEVFLEPITFKGVNLGVLIAATGANIADQRTEQLSRLFSSSIGLAINNALTHSKYQTLAAVDSLTGIYNRRFGMGRLKEDFALAVREHSNLTVAMIDIDHFKLVNDNYGHLIGDKAIVLTSKIIKNALREGDIAVRYGGEEFLIILHGASSENAMSICERIRHQVRDTVLMEGQQQIDLRVSIGLCAYPEQVVDNEVSLIDLADKALYTAKQSGRDKVVKYGQLA